jgi:hypothetical protein
MYHLRGAITKCIVVEMLSLTWLPILLLQLPSLNPNSAWIPSWKKTWWKFLSQLCQWQISYTVVSSEIAFHVMSSRLYIILYKTLPNLSLSFALSLESHWSANLTHFATSAKFLVSLIKKWDLRYLINMCAWVQPFIHSFIHLTRSTFPSFICYMDVYVVGNWMNRLILSTDWLATMMNIIIIIIWVS